MTIEVAGAPVVEGLTLTVAAGDKLGVVGRKGATLSGRDDLVAVEREGCDIGEAADWPAAVSGSVRLGRVPHDP